MENFNGIRRSPWFGAAKRGPAPFTMWTPQDSTEQPDPREPHDSRRGERGRPGERRGGHGRGHDRRGQGGRGDMAFGPAGFGPGAFGPGGSGRRGFGPGNDLGRGRGRGGRGRRGDVRAAILLLLDESPLHGYELIQQIAARSEGAWKPSPGSIYPALAQLEDEGLVTIEKVAGRKTAQLTQEGRAYIEQHRADLGSPWDDVRDTVGSDAIDLRGLIGLLMGAAGQVAAVGSADQVTAAGEVLVDARRALYRILAEDGAPGAPRTDDEADA